MTWNETLALLSVAGFAIQRTLELLDPIVITRLAKRLKQTDPATAKTWIMAVTAFLLGLAISFTVDAVTELKLPWALGHLVLALAISTGSNAANSLVKYGEYAKEAKKEKLPHPPPPH